MKRTSDQTYLLNEQYRDSSNLSARAALHTRFSTNSYGWHRWVFDQVLHEAPDTARVLELGSGPGWLWRENAARVPAGWQIILSDFSPGMVAESRRAVANDAPDLAGRITWQQIDAQAIPHPAGAFDVVIANHMLYHVPDRAKAIAEIARVLRAEGWFFAATNGLGHMREINDLMKRFEQASGMALGPESRFSVGDTFSLENGAPQIAAEFARVEVRKYADGLVVTEVEPLVAYIASYQPAEVLTEGLLAALRAFIAAELAKTGAFDITKDAGLFIARKA